MLGIDALSVRKAEKDRTRTLMRGKVNFVELGARLRANRMGRGLSPDDLAARLGISRAALYRAEKGEIAKIEMLAAIADELNVSLPSLLGAGIEYVDNAVGFFERMRHIEEDGEQIIGLFSPISYLVTTAGYDEVLYDVLRESTDGDRAGTIDQIIDILKKEKSVLPRAAPCSPRSSRRQTSHAFCAKAWSAASTSTAKPTLPAAGWR
ncbi:helix-turn-helix transcriptional regulator [Tritonibacter mobilis]|nr:helix-turn-helix transcriptional regulator [Tritonibacter mobilis]